MGFEQMNTGVEVAEGKESVADNVPKSIENFDIADAGNAKQITEQLPC